MPKNRKFFLFAFFPFAATLGLAFSFRIEWPDIVSPMAWGIFLAFLAGTFLPRLYWNAFRSMGLVPVFTSLWFAESMVVLLTGVAPSYLSWVSAGIVGAASNRYATTELRGWDVWWYLGSAFPCVGVAFAVVTSTSIRETGWLSVALVVVTGLLALLSWLFLLRPAIELACEPIIRLQYRIRSVGPGVEQIPMHGPSIVIANHACWFDPFFLALLLPRPITPMMTSDFYDLPVARWLLKRVFHAIRVPEKSLKQDVPDEIREAIAALDRGECVVIFPEGMLCRSEEKPLKRFGRGVWQILVARPDTPVFACWIEGGWRSYCSYFNGPPIKNKRPDFRRPIRVAVPAPIAVDAETLSKHLTTRIALMNAVLESRKLLDLPEVPAL